MKKTLIHLLQDECTHAIKKSFGSDIPPEESIAEVTLCTHSAFGHYQCNNALKLSKILKKNPREVAQTILSHFEDSLHQIEKTEIAGPGFINFHLSPTYLSSKLSDSLQDPSLGVPKTEKPQKIIVDFSSPNIAKELHVGHLRSTIIGDCLARLFEYLGHDVLRLNHVGDWGSQFGMLIAYMKRYEKPVLEGTQTAALAELSAWYKKAKALFDSDPAFKKDSQLEVVALQGGNKESLQIWNLICSISRKAFQEIYDLLDVKIIERGESFYNSYLKDLVEDLEKKHLIHISDGAKCIFLEGFKNRDGDPLPLIIQKSDGGFNYDTTDLAGFRQRVSEEKADRIIIVTDAGQSLHFQMIYQTAVLAGYLDPQKVKFDHVPFGLVLGSDGKKFRTRSGETEKLIDLLEEAIEQSKKMLQERLPDIDEKELSELSKALGIGAIKYSDLSCHRLKDYTFSYERMLKFEGNTAAFLLYAYVRTLGIKKKLKTSSEKIQKDASKILLNHPSEKDLGFHLLRFGEVLETVSKDLLPNRLTDYLYELAEKFNAFFRDCHVEGSPEEKSRLALCEISSQTLKQGLSILGLQTVQRM